MNSADFTPLACMHGQFIWTVSSWVWSMSSRRRPTGYPGCPTSALTSTAQTDISMRVDAQTCTAMSPPVYYLGVVWAQRVCVSLRWETSARMCMIYERARMFVCVEHKIRTDSEGTYTDIGELRASCKLEDRHNRCNDSLATAVFFLGRCCAVWCNKGQVNECVREWEWGWVWGWEWGWV